MNTRTEDGARDLLRSVGGLLFAAGAVVLVLRKSQSWGYGGRMVAILIPAIVLYGLALAGPKWLALGGRNRRPRDLDGTEPAPGLVAEPWQSVLIVFAVILDALWLTTLFHWVGAHGPLVTAAVFLLTAVAAAYAAWRAAVRYAAFLCGLSLLIAWLALWGKILNHPSATTDRWLLIIIGLIFAAAAVALGRHNRRESAEAITVAGLAGVAAASLGVFGALIAEGLGTMSLGAGRVGSLGVFDVKQHFIWDLILLLISVGVIWYGSRARVRGPGYVGALGLLTFLFSAGFQITAREANTFPSNSVVGWPLALLVLGLIGLVAGFAGARRTGAGSEGQPPPVAGTTPPAPPVPPGS